MNKRVKPFLKWVGGKRQLMSEIINALPSSIKDYQYIEPFIGGGSVLFHLQPKSAIINDLNVELINAYLVIKNRPDELLEALREHKNSAEHYYNIRGLDRTEAFATLSPVIRAARIIFLNKTCFNGLYRVNRAGQFNVPFGKYVNPKIIDEEVIKAVSEYLNVNNIQIFNNNYLKILENAENNSFVYLDPPYVPTSNSSSFTDYVVGGFNYDDQIKLREACDVLDSQGIKFLQSNSATDFIFEQYKKYDIQLIQARRSINSVASKRGHVSEVLIRNYV